MNLEHPALAYAARSPDRLTAPGRWVVRATAGFRWAMPTFERRVGRSGERPTLMAGRSHLRLSSLEGRPPSRGRPAQAAGDNDAWQASTSSTLFMPNWRKTDLLGSTVSWANTRTVAVDGISCPNFLPGSTAT